MIVVSKMLVIMVVRMRRMVRMVVMVTMRTIHVHDKAAQISKPLG